jgi:CBS domain-containing protein
MHKPLTVTPDAPLHLAASRLREGKYGCLPVVKDGKLVGILTEADFVRLAEVLLRNLIGDRADKQDELKAWFDAS